MLPVRNIHEALRMAGAMQSVKVNGLIVPADRQYRHKIQVTGYRNRCKKQ